MGAKRLVSFTHEEQKSDIFICPTKTTVDTRIPLINWIFKPFQNFTFIYCSGNISYHIISYHIIPSL